ncbi:homeobox protein MSX-2 [Phymastichus coffea]|uniref:homeobox protein MSX-2 n=1 Tax=Phymastichus coffea TaxID=108790 RepID=UPI00273C1DE9|nr:homeobox protein MSX-2 [Phymastichus coffea]
MSHTHRRGLVSDFSIERILAKDTAASSAGAPPCSSACVANGKVNRPRNDCACQTNESESETDRPDAHQTPKDSVEIVNRACDMGPAQINEELSWLRCTRYHPPKIPRRPPVDKNLKRTPGRYPRIPFTKYQLDAMEEKYQSSAYLSRKDVMYLSEVLQLPQRRIKIWFQNRRARERRESQMFTQTHSGKS